MVEDPNSSYNAYKVSHAFSNFLLLLKISNILGDKRTLFAVAVVISRHMAVLVVNYGISNTVVLEIP